MLLKKELRQKFVYTEKSSFVCSSGECENTEQFVEDSDDSSETDT